LAAAVAGVVVGPTATDDEMIEAISKVIFGIQPVIGAALATPR
jgi:hypothetical protein